MSWWCFFRDGWRQAEATVFLIVLALGLLIAWGFGYPPWQVAAGVIAAAYSDPQGRIYLIVAGCLLLARIGIDIFQRYYPKPIHF